MEDVLAGKYNYTLSSYAGATDVYSCVMVYSDAGACRARYIDYLRASLHYICNDPPLFGI